MKKKLPLVAAGACALFVVFCLGYLLASRTRAGTFAIVATPKKERGGLSAASPAPATSPSPAPETDGGAENQWVPININTATAKELTDLPGIGPKLAERIIAWRTEHGPFTETAQIMEVSGIGEKTFEALKDLIKTE